MPQIGMDPNRREEPPILMFYHHLVGDGGQQSEQLGISPAKQGNQQNRHGADNGNQGAFFSRTLREEGALDADIELF